ncbi:MAG: phosphoribosylamine--glycine ligase [Candidatus Portnoybacteria bacterium]|nr:phosphoribosylamine--glycine ligase [Candidatus Portnoybacteria bacterium]
MSEQFQPKKFLFVSWISLSGDLAWKIKKEGHEVKVYIENKAEADVYDGILDKVQDWKEHIDWADVIVFDDIGFGNIADKLRQKGKLVFGGSAYADKTEEDREFGQEEMKKCGLNTLPHYNFDNFDSAIEFLKNNPGRYVFKPNDSSAGSEKELLFIGEEEDGRDIIEIMEHNKVFWAKKIKSFQLQKFVAGVEVAVGGFFNGKKFIYPVNINFEHKKLFPGERGPSTGEMGTLMYWNHASVLVSNTLTKMEPALAACGYTGYYDINCIVNGRGIYPLEITARICYPAISIQMEGITDPMGEIFYKVVTGEDFEIKTRKGFQIGVVVAVPPFPFSSEEILSVYRDSSILFKNNNSLEGIHIGDVKIIDGDFRLAGESGYALVVTGSGITVDEARRQAYNRIKNIRLQNMFYRVDIGTRWFHDSDKLQSWGYV